MSTADMTFGLITEDKKASDSSRFYDPARHPFRNWSGPLYTIDRGTRFRNLENRFWVARGDIASDGLPNKLGILYRNVNLPFDYGYDMGTKLCKTLEPRASQTVYIRGSTKVVVTRIR